MDTYKVFLKESAKRRAQVIKYRAKKMTMQQIADKMGISRQRVGKLLKTEAAKLVKESA